MKKQEFINKPNFLTRMFGDKKFVRFYWKLMLPGVIYGLFAAMGPFIAVNLFRLFRNSATDDHVITILYTTYAKMLSIQIPSYTFITTIARASVPGIVTKLGMGDEKALHRITRFAIFFGLLFCLSIVISIQIFARDISVYLLASNNQNISNTTNELVTNYFVSYLNVVIYTVFFAFTNALYNQLFYSTKYLHDLMHAYGLRFVFMIIAYPLFIRFSYNLHIADRLLGVALLSVSERALTTIYLVIFSHLPSIFRIRFFQRNKNIVINNTYSQKDIQKDVLVQTLIYKNHLFAVYKEQNRTYAYACFRSGLLFKWQDVKDFVYLGWPALFDGWLIAASQYYFGTLIMNINYPSWADYNKITVTTSLLRSSSYEFINSTSWALPAALVTYEIGRGNIKQAKQNAWRLFWWGHFMAFVFISFFLSISFFLPGVINKGDGERIIRLATIFIVWYAFGEGFWIAFRNIFVILSSGGNRFAFTANALVTIVRFFVIAFALNFWIQKGFLWSEGSDLQLSGYYFIQFAYPYFKYAISLLLFLFTKWTYSTATKSQNNWIKTFYDFVKIRVLTKKQLSTQ